MCLGLSTCCDAVSGFMLETGRFSWSESNRLPLDEMFADYPTGAESASGCYWWNVARHDWSRADGHMNTMNLNVHLHRCCANTHHMHALTGFWSSAHIQIFSHFACRTGSYFHKQHVSNVLVCFLSSPAYNKDHKYMFSACTGLTHKHTLYSWWTSDVIEVCNWNIHFFYFGTFTLEMYYFRGWVEAQKYRRCSLA